MICREDATLALSSGYNDVTSQHIYVVTKHVQC
jgi:hypothetical protein